MWNVLGTLMQLSVFGSFSVICIEHQASLSLATLVPSQNAERVRLRSWDACSWHNVSWTRPASLERKTIAAQRQALK